MAKKKMKLDDFEDFDLDAALDELEDFGMGEAEPPKNAREAVGRSLKDAKKGATEQFAPNIENASKFLKAAVPNSLLTEVSDISDAIYGQGGIKEALTESLKEVKKSGKEVKDTLKTLLPKDGKLDKTLDKISSFLGLDDDENSLAAQMAASNDALMQGLQAELQNQFTKESTLAVLQGNIQRKQNASMLDVLKGIQDNTTVLKTFQIEVTNNYYRKSLELQYKQLFTTKEHLEMTTKMYNTFKNQYEAIIKNTGLPEFVKTKRSEYFQSTMRQNFDNNIQKYLFNENSVIRRIKENVSRRIRHGFENFLEGISTVNMGLGAAGAMKDMEEMGMTKSYLAGSYLGEWGRNFIAKNVGERLSRTKLGKKAVYGVKNFAADPSAWFEEKLGRVRKTNPKSRLGRMGKSALEWSLDGLRDMTSLGGEYKGITFGRQDPNDTAIFDNKTQTSIVKIIPGLLNQIYGEIKSQRDGSNPDDNELIYDYTRQGLYGKKDFITNLKSDFKLKMQTYNKYNTQEIAEIYKNYGKGLKNVEINLIVTTLVSYMLTGRAKLNPSVIINPDFLNMLPLNLRERARLSGLKIIESAVEDPYIVDRLVQSLFSIRKSIPNVNIDIDMLYATGNAAIGEELGLLKRDPLNQNHYVDRDGVLGYMGDTIKGAFNPLQPGRSRRKKKEKSTGSKTKSNLDKFKEKSVSMVEKIKDLGKKENIDKLREEFFESKEYAEGKVEDFTEWVAHTTGLDKETVKQTIIEKTTKASETASETLKKQKEEILNKIQGEKKKEKVTEQVMNEILQDEAAMENLRTEFFESKEYKSGTITDFPTWLEALGFKSKKSSTFMRILKTTWKWDRKIAGFLLKAPFKGLYQAGKLGYGMTKFTVKNVLPAGIKTSWLAATALPRQLFNVGAGMFGYQPDGGPKTWGMDRKMARKGMTLGPSVIGRLGSWIGKTFRKNRDTLSKRAQEMGAGPDTQILSAGFDRVINFLSELREKDGPVRRAGNWLDRLNIFKKKGKQSKEEKEKGKGLLNFMKEHKGLTIGAGLLLVGGLLKTLNLTGEDIRSFMAKSVEVGKSIFKGIGWVVDKVNTVGQYIGKFIDKVGGFLGFDFFKKKQKMNPDGTPMVDDNGDPVYEDGPMESMGGKVGTAAAIAGGTYLTAKAVTSPIRTAVGVTKAVVKAPLKAAGIGFKMVMGVVDFLRGKFGFGWMGDLLFKYKDKLIKLIDKVVPSFETFKKTLSRIWKGFTNPKVAKVVGKKAAAKAAAKVGTMVASAATGIGALLTAGMIIWDLAWIIYYMYSKDMGFWSALSYQFCGVDILSIIDGEDEQKKEERKAEAKIESGLSKENLDVNPNDIKKENQSSRKDNEPSWLSRLWSSTKQTVSNGINYIKNTETYKKAAAATKEFIGLNQKPQSGSIGVKDNSTTTPTSSVANISSAVNGKPLKEGELPFKVRGSADYQNLHPELLRRWSGMANEYYSITGQKLNFNSGKRSLEQQAELFRRYGPGKAARPNPLAPHISGVALDADSAQMNRADQLGLIDKWGLSRPLLKGLGRTKPEAWHVELAEARDLSRRITENTLAQIGMVNPNLSADRSTSNNIASIKDNSADGVNSVSPDEIKKDESKNNTKIMTASSVMSTSPLPEQNTKSTLPAVPSAKNELALPSTPVEQYKPNQTTTVQAESKITNNTDMKVLSTISDTLIQSLRVQMHMAQSLTTIASNTTGPMSGNGSKPQTQNISSTPIQPALNVSRTTYSF